MEYEGAVDGQPRSNVVPMKAPEGAFDGDAFEGKEVTLEVRIKDMGVLKAVCRPNIISSNDLSDYQAVSDRASYNTARKKVLIQKMANAATDDEAAEFKAEYDEIAAEPDEMSLNTESILRPGTVLISWNYWLHGEFVPIDTEQIKQKASLSIVNALSLEIINYVNGNQQKGSGAEKKGGHLFGGFQRKKGRK